MTALSLAELLIRGHNLIEAALTAPSDGPDKAASGDPYAFRSDNGTPPRLPVPPREGAVVHLDPHSRHWSAFVCHIDETGDAA